MNQDFKSLIDQLEPTLQRLVSSKPIDISAIPRSPKLAGVYVFYEGNEPIYVGRTKNLRGRIKSHYNLTNPNMASFAFLIACESYGRKKAAYKKEGGRKDLHSNPAFREHLIGANERLKVMTVRFVEITDPKMQHIFEIFAAMALNTPHNTFETH